MGYMPVHDSAQQLKIMLGYVYTQATVTGTDFTQSGGTGPWLTAADVGNPVMVMGAGPAGIPLWTKIDAVIAHDHATLHDAASIAVSNVIATMYRAIAFDTAAAPAYILDGSIQFSASLSNRPTLNFTVYSADGSFVPLSGQPILMTTDPSDQTEASDIFGGRIDQVQIVNYPGSSAIQTACQCVSWEAVLAARLLRNTTVLNPIITDTIQQYLSTGSPPTSLQYRIFFLSRTPTNMTSVKLNGTTQTFAPYVDSGTASSHAADWYWSPTQNLIWQDDWHAGIPAPTLVPGVDTLVVEYEMPPADVLNYYLQTAKGIIVDLLALITSEGFRLVAVDGPNVVQISFTTEDTVDSAITSLCTYISDGSANYWYFVSPRQTVHFEIQGVTRTAPWNISTSDGSDGNVLMQVSNTITREKYGNGVLLDIGSSQSTVLETDSMPGDGTSVTFNTVRPLASAPTINRIDNSVPASPVVTPQTVGLYGDPISGTGMDWYWTLNSTEIKQDAGGTVLAATDTLSVAYYPSVSSTWQYIYGSAIAARQAIEGGSGETDIYISTSSGAPSIEGTDNPAETIAKYRAALSEKVEVQTYRSGLTPGMAITVNLPTIATSADYVVDTVSLADQDRLALYDVYLVSGAVIGDWRTAFKSLGAGGSSSGGAVSVGTAGGGSLAPGVIAYA